MLNPAIKANEFSITFRRTDASCTFNSSTPTPEISDTYPGTSGNTQGERNETKPARKAAIGSGRFAIQRYCTFYPCTGAQYHRSCAVGAGLLTRFGAHFRRYLGDDLSNKLCRHGRSEHSAVFLLLDFQAAQCFLDIRIGSLSGNRDLGRLKDCEKRIDLDGQLLRGLGIASECFRLEMHCAMITYRRNDR